MRLAQHGTAPRVAVELSAEYLSADLKPVNVIADIPGTDRADEIVMLGAHLDSWHSGTGATGPDPHDDRHSRVEQSAHDRPGRLERLLPTLIGQGQASARYR